jgi:hypothetical protein
MFHTGSNCGACDRKIGLLYSFEAHVRKLLTSFGAANFWKRFSVATAFLFAFITSAGQVPLFACSCVGRGQIHQHHIAVQKSSIFVEISEKPLRVILSQVLRSPSSIDETR